MKNKLQIMYSYEITEKERICFFLDLKQMNTNLVTFAKELSRTKSEELPEKLLQLQRRIFFVN